MKYRIDHTTTYVYSTPVALSHNQVHLVPRNSDWQACQVSRQHIHPTPSVVRSSQDFFGNNAGFFVIEHPHRELTVISQSVVEVTKPAWPEPASTPAWESVRDALRRPIDEATLDARLYVFESPLVKQGPEVREFAAPSFRPQRPIVEAIAELTTRIYREFKYDPAATVISTPTLDVLRLRRGVCQDFAHLQIACLRSLGIAARYVSGYLVTDPPAGQPKLVGADASHAWLSVWCPGSGWIDFDPTNGCLPSDRHITIAWGRDYSDVSPVKGVVLGGGMHTLRISVDVSPVNGS